MANKTVTSSLFIYSVKKLFLPLDVLHKMIPNVEQSAHLLLLGRIKMVKVDRYDDLQNITGSLDEAV